MWSAYLSTQHGRFCPFFFAHQPRSRLSQPAVQACSVSGWLQPPGAITAPPSARTVPVPSPRARTAKVPAPAPKPSARKKAKGTRPPRCADFEIKSFGQLMAEKKKQ